VTLADTIREALESVSECCLDDDYERERVVSAVLLASRRSPEAQRVKTALGDDPMAYTIRLVGSNGKDQQRYHLAAAFLAGVEPKD
jgi:hypothetical protein